MLTLYVLSLYTLDDDSERPMDYETSLLPKVFPLQTFSWVEISLTTSLLMQEVMKAIHGQLLHLHHSLTLT